MVKAQKSVADYLKYKSEVERIVMLHPIVMGLLCEFILYCSAQALPCVITDSVTTPAEDSHLARVSDTHRTGRAFDASLHGWNKTQVDAVVEYFNKKYPSIGSVSKEDPTKTRLIYAHNAGSGMHLHFQVNRKYALPTIDL